MRRGERWRGGEERGEGRRRGGERGREERAKERKKSDGKEKGRGISCLGCILGNPPYTTWNTRSRATSSFTLGEREGGKERKEKEVRPGKEREGSSGGIKKRNWQEKHHKYMYIFTSNNLQFQCSRMCSCHALDSSTQTVTEEWREE